MWLFPILRKSSYYYFSNSIDSISEANERVRGGTSFFSVNKSLGMQFTKGYDKSGC